MVVLGRIHYYIAAKKSAIEPGISSGNMNRNENTQISSFVKWELDAFRERCNFTPDELTFFDLRAKGASIVAITLEMHISEWKATDLSKHVKRKMLKVLPL